MVLRRIMDRGAWRKSGDRKEADDRAAYLGSSVKGSVARRNKKITLAPIKGAKDEPDSEPDSGGR